MVLILWTQILRLIGHYGGHWVLRQGATGQVENVSSITPGVSSSTEHWNTSTGGGRRSWSKTLCAFANPGHNTGNRPHHWQPGWNCVESAGILRLNHDVKWQELRIRTREWYHSDKHQWLAQAKPVLAPRKQLGLRRRGTKRTQNCCCQSDSFRLRLKPMQMQLISKATVFAVNLISGQNKRIPARP